jgi:hypothetical protein
MAERGERICTVVYQHVGLRYSISDHAPKICRLQTAGSSSIDIQSALKMAVESVQQAVAEPSKEEG